MAGSDFMVKVRREAFVVAVALGVALLAGSLLILVIGQSPLEVYQLLISRTWGDEYGMGQVLFKSTPLIFTGLAVALAFQVGLFNIGAEGQMAAGMFATALCGAYLPGAVPWPLALALCLAAGMLAGGAIGAVPGALRAYYGAHEVINTIMLNFIVGAVVLWLGNEYFFVGESMRTESIGDNTQLSPLGTRFDSMGIDLFRGSAVNTSFFIAIAVAVLVHIFLTRTRRGYEWRAVGSSPRAAENGGIDVRGTIVWSMAISGALAGAVGANYVLGYKFYYEMGMGTGVGFMGIAVALLARNHPIGIIFAALLFGTLSHGGLAVTRLAPKELVDVLQAIIILTVAATSAYMHRRWSRSVAVATPEVSDDRSSEPAGDEPVSDEPVGDEPTDRGDDNG